ncbi:hypothetical protein [Cupriavidus sp. AU9028]|nr:hypothetical protein [Cupriavidus sp. AU9028]MBY4897927.1 hypothetical protein [Cupriavidus sp. AU9028]
MRQDERYGTNAEGARESTRPGKRRVFTSPILWIAVALAIVAFIVLPMW